MPKGQDDSHWRYENDPKGARRAEIRIALCWTVTVLSSIGLAWVYVDGGQTQAEGTLWGTAFWAWVWVSSSGPGICFRATR